VTLQQLIYFKAVFDNMHFSNAAKEMHVSQPSISYAIAELESELGVKLFLRQGNKLSASDYGEILYRYTVSILEQLDECVEEISKQRRGSFEKIKIGYLFSLSMDVVPPIIEKYYEAIGHHDVTFEFVLCRVDEVARMLNDSEIDIAFVAGPFHDSFDTPFVLRPVCKQELFLVVPKGHKLGRSQGVFFSEIINEKYIAINPGKGLRRLTDRYFKARNASPQIIFSVDDTESLVSYVEAGIGVAILPLLPSLNREKVNLLRIVDYPMTRSVCVLYSNEQLHNRSTRNFLDFLDAIASSDQFLDEG